jgi:hypothetical protein
VEVSLRQAPRNALGHRAQLVVQPVAVGDVALEGLLVADRDRRLGDRLDAAAVDPARSVAELASDLAREQRQELGVVECREVADRLDAGRPQAFAGARAYAGELADVERREKRGLLARWDDGDAARLSPVARDLRHDLRR